MSDHVHTMSNAELAAAIKEAAHMVHSFAPGNEPDHPYRQHVRRLMQEQVSRAEKG